MDEPSRPNPPRPSAGDGDADQTEAATVGGEQTSDGVADDVLSDALRVLDAPLSDPGDHEGRYRFGELLGRGGMGEVWSVDDRHLARDVALKRMRKGAVKAEQAARFLREARLGGSLEHPNIVPIYDVGVDDEGSLFFTMKRLRGRSVAELLADGALGSRHERLSLFRKVCDAIAFAHANEVIHRDLKPDNVMVGEFGEVVVVDWGVAKRLGEAETQTGGGASGHAGSSVDSSDLTGDGSLVGTPAFMAPEQAAGRRELIDARTDVYALGVLLYVLLTEQRPYRGSVPEILAKICEGRLEPPSEHAQVPPELEAIILRAMAHDREARYPSVVALADDIQAHVERRPVSVVRYSPGQRLRKWAARNRKTVTAATITGFVGLAALLVGGTLYLREVTAARNDAMTARDEAMVARDRAMAAEVEAQIRNGEAQVGLGLALARGGELIEAVEHLDTARSIFVDNGESTLPADLVHAWVDGDNPPPLARLSVPATAQVLGASADHRRIAWRDGTRVVVEDWLAGHRVLDRELVGWVDGPLAVRGDDFLHLARIGDAVEARTLVADTVVGRLPSGASHRLCHDGSHALVERGDGLHQRVELGPTDAPDPTFDCGTMLATSGSCSRVLCDPERTPVHQRLRSMVVFDATTGQALHRLRGSNTRAISPEGDLLVTSDEHAGMRLWDLRTGEERWGDPDKDRSGFGYFAEGQGSIYLQAPDLTLHRWTIDGQWVERRRLDGHVVGSIGDTYMITRPPGAVSVWSVGPGAHAPLEIVEEIGRRGAVGEGELVAVSGGPRLFIYDPLTGAELGALEGIDAGRCLPAMDGRGRLALVRTRGLALFDLTRASTPAHTLPLGARPDAHATGARFLPGQDRVVVSDSAGVVHVWDLSRAEIVERYETGQYLWDIAVGPDGRMVYGSGRIKEESILVALDLTTGDSRVVSPRREEAYGIAATRHGGQTIVAVGSQSGAVEVWADGRPEPLTVLEPLDVPVMQLDFTYDDELLVGQGYGGELLVWRTRDWTALPTLPFSGVGMRASRLGRHLIFQERRFDLELASRGNATRLAYPAGPGESEAQRLTRAMEGLALQQHWAGASRLVEQLRAQGAPVDELLAARIAWKTGDAEGALAALRRVDEGAVARPAELEIWLRLLQ